MKRAAIFLDRDDTLIEDPGYLADPSQVKLIPDAPAAIRRWNEAGFRVIVVTNQSGIARGMITEVQLEQIHSRLQHLLESQDATLDAIYYCPYLDGPEAVVPEYCRDSELRKPKPGMLLKAAADLDLDLTASWMIGNSPRDVQAGRAAGCSTILIANGEEVPEDVHADYIVDSLTRAAELTLQGPPVERDSPPPPAPPPVDVPPADIPSQDAPLADSSPVAAGTRDHEILEVLKDIRSLLHQQRRDTVQSNFSLPRLGATLLQIIAIAILLWGIAGFVNGEIAATLLRLVLAGVIQLCALALFITDRHI